MSFTLLCLLLCIYPDSRRYLSANLCEMPDGYISQMTLIFRGTSFFYLLATLSFFSRNELIFWVIILHFHLTWEIFAVFSIGNGPSKTLCCCKCYGARQRTSSNVVLSAFATLEASDFCNRGRDSMNCMKSTLLAMSSINDYLCHHQ